LEPTGRDFEWTEIHTFRCRDGRIVEHSGVVDLVAITPQRR
jgi:predicted ester cyclase